MHTQFAATLATHVSPNPVATHAGRGVGKLWSTLQEVCDLLKIPATGLPNDPDFTFQHLRFRAGQRVYMLGQPFDHLFIINSGFLKTVLIDEAGTEQVLGFPMKGDMIGMDGIHSRHYASEAVALSDCDIILIPFKKLSTLSKTYPALELAIFGAMSQELIREQGMASMLGSLSAEARVARFLVKLSERFSDMGYSGKQFNLRMTRNDIGSYLGLTLETVSRTMSAFAAIGYITVAQRAIGVLDIQALRTLRRLPPSTTRQRKANSTIGMLAETAA